MATAASSTNGVPKATGVGTSYPNGVNGHANGHNLDNVSTNTAQQTLTAAKSSSQDSGIVPSLLNRVSSPHSVSSAEPTLEEKKELCKLLKNATRDLLDPAPIDVKGLAEEFERGGYQDLAKLEREITCLYLGGCHLKTLPSCILLLKGLRELNLICNELETLPDELIEIPELYTLHLQGNRFKKVPSVVVEMSKKHGFSYLDLSSNDWLKEIPCSLGDHVRILSLPDPHDWVEG